MAAEYALGVLGIDALRLSIEGQLQEIEREVLRLTAALEALEGNGGHPQPIEPKASGKQRPVKDRGEVSAAAPEGGSAARQHRRTSPEEVSTEKLEAMLGESERGVSAVAIAKRLSASADRVLTVLRQLEREGRARKEGSRRTSLWVAVRDGQESRPSASEASKDEPQHEQDQRELAASRSATAQAPPSDKDTTRPGGSATDSVETISADDVLAALRDGYDKPSAIAEHLGVPVSVVRERLRELENAKRIRKRPRA